MSESSNTSSNPSQADRETAKAAGIGWHPRGGWCKKFSGDANRTYFGKVRVVDAIKLLTTEQLRRGGRLDREKDEVARAAPTLLKDAVNLYLTHLDSQSISFSQRASYGNELSKLVKHLGPRCRLLDLCAMNAPEKIFRPLRATAVARGLSAAEKHVTQVRTFLDWCSRVRRLMPPPFYADSFDHPGAKEKRDAKKADAAAKGTAIWDAAEVRAIVDAAKSTDIHRYAQVLLMINGGMGATDLSNLIDSEVDLARGCIVTLRSKTQVPRTVPLWAITADAMKASRAARPEPADLKWADRWFLTPHGRPLVNQELSLDRKRNLRVDAVKNWIYALLNGRKADMGKKAVIRLKRLKRHRAGGYTLRACFVTFSAGQEDTLVAIILGHKLPREIMAHYMRGDVLGKLRAVVDHVYSQIF